MQVGLSQIVMSGTSMADFFAQAKAAGYEVVEVCMRREGDLTPQTSAEKCQAIAAQAAAAGVRIVSMTHSHVTGNLLDSGEAQQTAIAETEAGLRAAAAMGVSCTLHTLGRLKAEVFYDQAYANAVQSLRTLAKTAEKLKINLALEFVWNGFAFSPLEYRRLLDEVGSPYVGFYFDPGNMAVFQFPQHWARILGKHIKMVHLKDWQGSALNGSWPALLKGKVDYAAVNRELRAFGYDGPMISEVPPGDCPLPETAQAIRKIITM